MQYSTARDEGLHQLHLEHEWPVPRSSRVERAPGQDVLSFAAPWQCRALPPKFWDSRYNVFLWTGRERERLLIYGKLLMFAREGER